MLIIGAGGFARQLIDTVETLRLSTDLVFYDDRSIASDKFMNRFPIISTIDAAKVYLNNKDDRFVLGLSGPATRKSFFEKFRDLGGTPVSVLSRDSLYGKYDSGIAEGCTVLPNCIIESSASLGQGVLLNVHVAVTHDSFIGDFCELGPGVIICGGCHIGSGVFVGAGAIILPGITVGNNAVIGAGAVVNKDVPEGETVTGVPAKKSL
jgi:sugar O-acyltransferase (sialic acid O-acetyltransferase NeuD family)